MRHQMLRSLPRLRSLFYECLRVHGPAPFLLFENTEDIMLAGQTFTPDPSRVFILLTGYIGQAQSPNSKSIPNPNPNPEQRTLHNAHAAAGLPPRSSLVHPALILAIGGRGGAPWRGSRAGQV